MRVFLFRENFQILKYSWTKQQLSNFNKTESETVQMSTWKQQNRGFRVIQSAPVGAIPSGSAQPGLPPSPPGEEK